MIRKIKKWWDGENIIHENHPDDPVIFIGWNNKKHWTSKLVHWIVSLFTNTERRATFLAVLAFITFMFMLLKYFTNTDADQNTTNPQRDNREPNTQIHTGANQGKG